MAELRGELNSACGPLVAADGGGSAEDEAAESKQRPPAAPSPNTARGDGWVGGALNAFGFRSRRDRPLKAAAQRLHALVSARLAVRVERRRSVQERRCAARRALGEALTRAGTALIDAGRAFVGGLSDAACAPIRVAISSPVDLYAAELREVTAAYDEPLDRADVGPDPELDAAVAAVRSALTAHLAATTALRQMVSEGGAYQRLEAACARPDPAAVRRMCDELQAEVDAELATLREAQADVRLAAVACPVKRRGQAEFAHKRAKIRKVPPAEMHALETAVRSTHSALRREEARFGQRWTALLNTVRECAPELLLLLLPVQEDGVRR